MELNVDVGAEHGGDDALGLLAVLKHLQGPVQLLSDPEIQFLKKRLFLLMNLR